MVQLGTATVKKIYPCRPPVSKLCSLCGVLVYKVGFGILGPVKSAYKLGSCSGCWTAREGVILPQKAYRHALAAGGLPVSV